MPLVLHPGATILLLIWIGHGTFTMLLAAQELTSVKASVRPHLFPITLHICIHELADVRFLLVCEIVRPFALKYPIIEISLVVTAIWPCVPTMAIFFAVLELACVAR